jgi:hypothetical protein
VSGAKLAHGQHSDPVTAKASVVHSAVPRHSMFLVFEDHDIVSSRTYQWC